ncbi:MAG TPA: alpha/beta hydrolase [Acidimicrobiia bacterium]|nr:alpha/beta hydrolase [Acidimicrobiia bacterium]
MERITIDSDGAVSVLDHGGKGPLIVGVHGLEGSAYNWSPIAPELTRNHRVVAPDLSGFGYTPPLGRGSTVEVNAKLVADVIKHFGDRAILIGNSMGGLISLLVAETYPDLVTGLVLIDPAAPVTNWLSIRPAAAARLSLPLLPGAGPRIVDLYRATQSAEEGVAEALAFVAKDADALNQEVWDHALEIARLRRSQPWSTDALIEAARSIAPYVILRSRFATVLHRATQPTLLVHGTEDRLIHVETARWIARQRPDWTHAIFEGIGHVPMLEAPERFLAVFATWEEAVFGPPGGG